MKRISSRPSILLLLVSVSVFTCSLQSAIVQSSGRILVKAGHLLDVRSGKVLSNQTVLIEDGKIVSVGPAADAKSFSADTVIDLSHATVLPGLIDAPTPFTTVRNVGADGYTDVALRDAINAGDVPGPRMLVSGPLLGITGGHCDNNLLAYEYHAVGDGVADGIAGVQHKVREVIKYGADLIKICATGGVLSMGDDPQHSQYTLEEMKAIVADAHRLGRKVAAHAHGAQGILWASEAGVDSIEHGSYIDDAGIASMKEHGTYLVPTLYLTDWFLANAEKLGTPPELIAK